MQSPNTSVVFHVADFGSNFLCFDRASIGLHHLDGLSERVTHPASTDSKKVDLYLDAGRL
jgi:hypothetical protein